MTDKTKYKIFKDVLSDCFSIEIYANERWSYLMGSCHMDLETCKQYLVDAKARNFKDEIIIEEGEI